jgi:hypothetical protein
MGTSIYIIMIKKGVFLSFLGIDTRIIKVPFKHLKDKKSTNQSYGSMYKEIVHTMYKFQKLTCSPSPWPQNLLATTYISSLQDFH